MSLFLLPRSLWFLRGCFIEHLLKVVRRKSGDLFFYLKLCPMNYTKIDIATRFAITKQETLFKMFGHYKAHER